MFNRKLRKSIESVERDVTANRNLQREEYWELFHKIDDLKKELGILVASLGMSRCETHKIEYIKKCGPEQP